MCRWTFLVHIQTHTHSHRWWSISLLTSHLITDVMESSTVHESSRATGRSVSVSWCDEKMVCCELDSPAKCLRSNLNPVAPSVPICSSPPGVQLVSDLMPFELTRTNWSPPSLDKHVAKPTAVTGRLQWRPWVSMCTCTQPAANPQTAVANLSSGPSAQLVMRWSCV